jgi:hypothetical protein
MTEHYAKVLANRPYDQLLLQVDGDGGTGKATVVWSLCAELKRLAGVDAPGLISSPVIVASGTVPFVRAAPIGVASTTLVVVLSIRCSGYQSSMPITKISRVRVSRPCSRSSEVHNISSSRKVLGWSEEIGLDPSSATGDQGER